MADEWHDVSAVEQGNDSSESTATWLDSKGLGKYASKIVELTDAETVNDLQLIDTTMVEEVIAAADMKLVSAKRLRVALAELRGAAQEVDSPIKPSGPQGEHISPTSCRASQKPQMRVQECVAICIDRSGSMGCPFAEVTLNIVQGSVAERTRMEAVKAMFYAFRDRVDSFAPGSHHLGLIQFDDKVERMLDLTPRLDVFEAIVDDMQKRGTTAIYSAIVEAASMLEAQFQKDPDIDLRVLVLTDGQNNAGVPPAEALSAVNQIGATVDAIIVGDRPDVNLRKIVTATGGECYQICNLGEGFELLEAEGVVSLLARRGGDEKPPFQARPMVDFKSVAEKSLTQVSAVQRAPQLAPELDKQVVADVSTIVQGSSAAPTTNSMKRILTELRQVQSGSDSIWMHSGEGVHIFPAPDNLNFWRVLVEGPAGSPFEGGVFALNVIIPNEYPFRPPQVTFQTPVYHCNVSDSGKICLNVLQDGWSPALSVPKCLEAIRVMLKEPNTDDSLRQWIAELTLAHQKTNGSDTRYYEKAREATRQNASLTVADWKQKWGC